jgi:gamma-glutamyltranspeptidase/glutathione hydrolase
MLLKRLGTMGFKQLLAPAARIAQQGFGVSERIRADWIEGVDILSADPDSVKTYLPGGKPPAAYALFRNPDLAHAFSVLQAGGRDAFYQSEIARAIVAKAHALGGTLAAKDLSAAHATWERRLPGHPPRAPCGLKFRPRRPDRRRLPRRVRSSQGR